MQPMHPGMVEALMRAPIKPAPDQTTQRLVDPLANLSPEL